MSLLVVITIPACGYVKEYFPDKEKDYQLTKEIPELVVPSDLSGNINEPMQGGFSAAKDDDELAYGKNKDDLFIETDNQSTLSVDLIKYSNKATRINIKDSFMRSWRIVGKALSRESIEIINRDVEKGVYTVQYDPDFEKVEDGSLWDEVLFIFGSDPAKEKEYRVEVFEKKTGTDVFVLDGDGNELSDGTGLVLLKMLYGKIKIDIEATEE